MSSFRCRHCRRALVSRPRGLCWICYYTPRVRRRFPARGSVGHGMPGPPRPPPAFPTDASPGSPAKLAVLEERARLGLELWHPDDAAFDYRRRPKPAARAM